MLCRHIVNNLRFADNIAAVAENSYDLQLIVDNIASLQRIAPGQGCRLTVRKLRFDMWAN